MNDQRFRTAFDGKGVGNADRGGLGGDADFVTANDARNREGAIVAAVAEHGFEVSSEHVCQLGHDIIHILFAGGSTKDFFRDHLAKGGAEGGEDHAGDAAAEPDRAGDSPENGGLRRAWISLADDGGEARHGLQDFWNKMVDDLEEHRAVGLGIAH